MADLQAAFDAAVADSKNLGQRPDNATLLRLYSLYKQATQGDNTQPKPGISDLVGRAKWDAWTGVKGMDREQAMQQYIDLVATLD
jgi:diazepam-binding inhibitor (GABA receptor modulator, acyl-CoA-binding protein)